MTAMALLGPDDNSERRRQRRARLAAVPNRYGIDFADVVSADGARWVVRLTFIPDDSGSAEGHACPPTLRADQILLRHAGEPIPEIGQVRFTPTGSETIDVEVQLRRPPPLRVRRGPLTISLDHVPGVDPLFDSADFYLDTARGPEAEGDVAPADVAPVGASYAVKDYAGFVGLMLDRLQLTQPGWEERSPADVGVMLVELMAYAADYLSYEQDAAATEAYLATARKRASLRRHARLLDYDIDEGRSARVWLQVTNTGDPRTLRAGTRFTTAGSTGTPVVFESLHDATVFSDNGALSVYGWGIEPYVLPAGATSLELAGHHASLSAGDVLVLVSQADEGAPYEACAVRLSAPPVLDDDPVRGRQITRITWFAEDATPFPVYAGESALVSWTKVYGNVILAEQHATFQAPPALPGGAPGAFVIPLQGAIIPAAAQLAGWQAAGLSVACADPYDHAAAVAAPAAEALEPDPAGARPCVQVLEARPYGRIEWTCRRAFLTSARFARDVVVDIDTPGQIKLQFGDGTLARALPEGAVLDVRFAVGGGPAGNVGRQTVSVIEDPAAVGLTVTNWLPAVGGKERETAAQIRNRAPIAFLEQERCVTPDDFAAAARRLAGVQDAAAGMEWTGSLRAVAVHVLPSGAETLDDDLRGRVAADLHRRRPCGIDVEVRPPRYVAVALALRVVVQPGYDRASLRRTLEAELGDGILPDGRTGLFHRSGYAFGRPLYLAPIIACAAGVPGVASVAALRFQRWDAVPSAAPASAVMVGATEIARVEGDPDQPGEGLAALTFEEAP